MFDLQTFGVLMVREMRLYVTIAQTGKWQIPKLFVSSQCYKPQHTLRENISFFAKVAKWLTKSKNTKRYIAKS